jgi:hypothetical protein
MNLQKEKARASQHYVGWRGRKHPCFFQSQGEFFFLTLPFIERANRWTPGLTEQSSFFNHAPSCRKTLSKRLADIVLPDALGQEIRLGSLWQTKPAVVVFLRHYG